MELYILSKQDLSILSICKLADYQINLDEETNAKSTFTLMKTNGLKKENYMVLNGLYRQFIFVIDDVQTEKESYVVTVTALDISNVFNRKVIEKNIDTMKSKSIEEFLANTISENFVNSDDTALNVNYIEIYWHTNTQGNVATNAENGLYNFHTFLINCRQYKNIYTDFKLENLGNPQTVEGKRISVEAKNRKIVDISLHGESTQKTRSGKNLLDNTATTKTSNGITFTVNSDGTVLADGTNDTNANSSFIINNYSLKAGTYILNGCPSGGSSTTYRLAIQKTSGWSILGLDTGSGSEQFTIDEATNIQVAIFIQKGQTISNLLFKPMIRLSSIIDDTYEQYGVMPSPDYRSEIENTEGKNILDISKYADISLWEKTTNYFMFMPILNEDIPKFKDVLSGRMELKGTAQNLVFGLTSEKATPTKELRILDNGTLQETSYDFKNADNIYLAIGNRNMISSDKSEIGLIFNNYNIMIEEGTVATNYAPYNSLGFKDEGKNKFNIDTIIENLYIIAQNGDRGNSSFTNTSGYIPINANEKYVITYDYTSLLSENARAVCFFDKNKNYVNGKTYSVTSKKVDVSSDFDGYVVFSYDKNCTDIMFSKEEQSIQYEPYKQQTAYFPLSEGQKLMKGSYLADDGVHHSRKQYTFTGNETGWNYHSGQNAFWIRNSQITNCKNEAHAKLCNYFPYSSSSFYVAEINTLCENSNSTMPMFIFKVSTDVANSLETWKTWLQNHNLIVEYELAEPETVPYTEEQQEAWNNIKNLTLFEGVNHISSDANMVLKYYPLEPVGLKFVLRIDIENKQETTELIDTTLPEVADYNKIYEEDVTAKVQVYIREDGSEYNLYLKTDRTTTTNKDDPDRASGKIEVISVETADRAEEEALNVMKGNNYKHLVEFKIAKTSKLMDITELHIGRPIKIKTDDDIYDSYISAITLSDENFVYFKSGSLRITLLDKLKKLVIL